MVLKINDEIKNEIKNEIRTEDKKLESNLNLDKLTKIFLKHLKLDSTKLMLLHTALATRLSQQMKGTPIWIICVGPSGDGKSEIIISLDDKVNTYILHELTSNSLVSGFEKKKKVGKNYISLNCDLAPQLDGKVVLIPDMAQILKMHPNEKAKVWAQLRELYDGRASKKTGNMEKEKRYDNLRVTLIACSTPAIDSQILIHQDLGTRELIFRTDINPYDDKKEKQEHELENKVWENEEHEENMRIHLNAAVKVFLQDRKIKNDVISETVKEKLIDLTEVLRHLRASAEIDSYTGELISIVYPEQPTRALKQLKRLFVGLKSLDDNYPDELALQIISHIVKSSCSFNRWLVLDALSRETKKVSVSSLAQKLKLGTKTVYRELNILWNQGLIDRILEPYTNYGKTYEAQFWEYKDTDLNKKIKKVFNETSYNPDTPDNNTPYIFSIRTFFQLKEEKEYNIYNLSSKTVYHDTPDIKGIKGNKDISSENIGEVLNDSGIDKQDKQNIIPNITEERAKEILEDFKEDVEDKSKQKPKKKIVWREFS